jgi:hypothetical protein
MIIVKNTFVCLFQVTKTRDSCMISICSNTDVCPLFLYEQTEVKQWNIFPQIYRILMKEIKDDSNEWKMSHIHRVGEIILIINMVKLVISYILFKMNYRFNVFFIKRINDIVRETKQSPKNCIELQNTLHIYNIRKTKITFFLVCWR